MSVPTRDKIDMVFQSRKRKHSDDNVLKADEPPQKKSRSEETNLWTTVKEYLKSPCENSQPSVSCPICMIPIAIRGVPQLRPCPWKLADESQKVGVVLPCSHIICQDCMSGHISAQDELIQSGDKWCPCCRADLLFSGCLHLIPSQRLPIATCENTSMVPLTRPEMPPNDFPEDCWECTAKCTTDYIDVSMSFVSELIHGVAQEESPEWETVVQQSQLLVRGYLDQQRIGPSWRKCSISARKLQVSFMDEGLADLAHDAIVHSRENSTTESGAFWFVPVHRNSRGPP